MSEPAFCIHDFRAALGGVRTYPEMGALLAGALGRLGFLAFNYGAPDYSGSMLSSMDPAWIERYVAGGYFRTDKLVLEASKRTSAFLASDIFVSPPATVREAEMEQAIADFSEGLVIPLHCPLVGFALLAAYVGPGDRRLEPFDDGLAAQLTLLAHTFHDRARVFYASNKPTDGRAALSPREAEMLRWSAAGKTAEEIAALLSVSPHTVRNHLAAARRKLGARSTAASVALLMSGGRGLGPSD